MQYSCNIFFINLPIKSIYFKVQLDLKQLKLFSNIQESKELEKC